MEKMAKILIVDDDSKLRKTLSDILNIKGYITIDVANGKAALNKVKDEAPAVALIDLKLTDISGIEVMKGIKKLSPETECIIITGYSSRETAIKAVNLGAFNYVDKPYDMEKLLLIIQRAVEKGESEKALKESEERWRGLFENSIEAAFTVDLRGSFTSINSALASIMGYKKEEIIGRNYTEFAPREVTDEVFKEYNRLYRTGEPIRGFIYETTRKSGEVRTVETYVNTIRKGGEIVGFQGTLRDITEKKRAEEALRKSEEKFRTVADFTYDWEYWRGIDGKFIYTSPSVERITGYSMKEIANDPKFIEKIVHPDDKHLLEEHKKTVLEDFKECSLTFRIITKGGETRWIGHVCQQVYDMDGNNLGRRGSNRDITNRKLAEDHIINLNRLLKSIRDINQLIVREKDRNSLLQEACEILVSVGGYRMAWVGFVDEEKKKVIPIAQSGFEEGYLDKIAITWDEKNTGKGPTGTAVRTKKPCILNDIINNPDYKPWKDQAEKRGYKSSASFPFIYNSKVNYTLNVYSDFIDFFDDEEIELLKEVSQDLAFALSAIETEEKHKETVEELSRSEERYRNLVENLNDVIFNLDMDGRFSYISPAIENISKYTVDEIEGKSFANFVYSEDISSLQSVFKLNDADIEKAFEFRVLDKDGEVRYVRVSSSMQMEGGKPVGLTGLMTDITESREAKEALEVSELKYRQLVESATIGIAIGQDVMLKYINPAFIEILGRSEKELFSKEFIEFMHPDDKEKAFEIHQKRIKGEEVPQFTEYRIIDRKGNIKWIEVSGTKTFWEGKPAALNFIHDITERKAAEEALEISELKYRQLFESASVGIAIAQDGFFKLINPILSEILGHSEEELLANSLFEMVMHPDDKGRAVKIHKKRVKGEELPHFTEYRIIDRDGNIRWVEVNGISTEWEGKPAALNFVSDITERKVAEEALKESEERYRILFENSPVGIGMGDVKGNIYTTNSVLKGMIGYTEEELKDIRLGSIYVNEDDRNEFLRRLKEFGYVKEFETNLKKKNDKDFVAILDGQLIEVDGRQIILTTVRDITHFKEADNALRESEERFRIAAESSSDLIYEWNVETDDLNWYGDIDGTLGYKKGEFGRTLNAWLESIHPDDKERLREMAEDHKKTGEPVSVEYRIGRKDGSWRYWMDKGTAMLDKAGKPVKLIGACIDITERKMAEKALRESEERYKSLVENLNDTIFNLDTKGRISYLSPVVETISDYKAEDLIGRPFADLVHPEDIEGLMESYEKTTMGQHEPYEFRVLKKDGTYFYVNTSSKLVYEDGKAIGISGVLTDITERKRAEEALIDEQEKAKRYLDTAGVILVALNGKGEVTMLNKKGHEILGYEEGEITGKNWFDTCLPEETRKEVKSVFRKLISGDIEPVEYYENPILTKSGEERIIAWYNTVIMGKDGKAIGTLGSGEDITERKLAEEALRDNEERFRTLTEQSSDAICIIDSDGIMRYVSQSNERVQGDKPEDIIGIKFVKIIHPDDLERMKEVFNNLLMKKKDSIIATYRCRHKDGSWRIMEAVCRNFFDDPKLNGIVANYRDITERKKVEETLIENTLYFMSLIDTLHEDIMVIDSDLRVTDINSSFLKKTGESRDDILGKPCYEVYRGYEDECASYGNFCPHRIVFKTGENVQVVHEHKNEDGSIQYIDIIASPLKDNTGKVVKIVEAMRDVTDIYRAHERIRESEEKFRNFFETSRDAVYLSTVDGKFEDINRSGENLFGYKRGELLSIDLNELYQNPDERTTFIKAIEENGFVKDYEIALKKKDGTKIDSLITAAVRLDRENRVIGYQGIIRDITERKKLETKLIQTEKLSSLGGILSGVAHELNNPLTSIIGNAQLLARKDCAGDVMKKLEVIQKESFRCTKIVGGLLSFAREHKPERKMIQINDVLKESYKLREYEFKMNDIDFEMELSEYIPQTSADPYQLQQVFINLINNAYDALRNQGGGSLVVRSLFKDDNIVLEFEDDGPGIPKKELNNIFDPFFTTKEVGEGTGLGLSIVYGIIKEHDGEIRVESVPGEGARFTIELPVVDEFSDEEGITDQEDIKRDGGGKTILVVEDEHSLRNLIQDALLHEDYIVNACGSVEKGIELLAENHYDIVISDMKMPGLGGKDLYRFIEKQYPSLLKKMFFVTGDVLGRETQDFLRKTGVEYIEKPFMIEELLNKVLKLSSDSE